MKSNEIDKEVSQETKVHIEDLTKENSTPIGAYVWDGKGWRFGSTMTTLECVKTAAKNFGYELVKVD